MKDRWPLLVAIGVFVVMRAENAIGWPTFLGLTYVMAITFIGSVFWEIRK